MGLYLVEPVVAVYAFAGFLMYPLVEQFVYRRLWEELTNTTYPAEDSGSRCLNHSNHSSSHEVVQRAASLFSLYSELFSMVPSLVATLVLVAYSDQRGRKITIVLPLVGTLVSALSFLAVSFFQLNVYLLIAGNFVSSLFGGVGTLLGGCFAYVADLCSDGKRRTLRMAGLDMVIGLLSGVASLSSGYFLRAAGFDWPFITAVIFLTANLLYVILVLEETVDVPPPDPPPAPEDGLHPPPRRRPMLRMVLGVYGLFATGGRGQRALLLLLLFTFASYIFANLGGLSNVMLYELNAPLCWNEILIGYGSALSTVIFLTSFAGVTLLSLCLPNPAIVFIGLLSVMSGLVMIAFAKTTLVMFLVRVPMLLAVMPSPVLRSMMSQVVSKSEQARQCSSGPRKATRPSPSYRRRRADLGRQRQTLTPDQKREIKMRDSSSAHLRYFRWNQMPLWTVLIRTSGLIRTEFICSQCLTGQEFSFHCNIHISPSVLSGSCSLSGSYWYYTV